MKIEKILYIVSSILTTLLFVIICFEHFFLHKEPSLFSVFLVIYMAIMNKQDKKEYDEQEKKD